MVHIPTILGVNQTEQGIFSYNESQQDALFLNFILVCIGQTVC